MCACVSTVLAACCYSVGSVLLLCTIVLPCHCVNVPLVVCTMVALWLVPMSVVGVDRAPAVSAANLALHP